MQLTLVSHVIGNTDVDEATVLGAQSNSHFEHVFTPGALVLGAYVRNISGELQDHQDKEAVKHFLSKRLQKLEEKSAEVDYLPLEDLSISETKEAESNAEARFHRYCEKEASLFRYNLSELGFHQVPVQTIGGADVNSTVVVGQYVPLGKTCNFRELVRRGCERLVYQSSFVGSKGARLKNRSPCWNLLPRYRPSR